MTAIPTFPEYVAQYQGEDSRRGEVARAVLADPDWPTSVITPAAVRDRLLRSGLPLGYVTTAASLASSYRRCCAYRRWNEAA